MTTREKQNIRIKELLYAGNTIQWIAKELDVHPERVRKHKRMIDARPGVKLVTQVNKDAQQLSSKSDKITYTSNLISGKKDVATRPKSEDEIFTTFEVDRSKWNIIKYEVSTWDTQFKNKDGEIETKELFSVHASFRPISIQTDVKTQAEAAVEEIRKHAPGFHLLNSWKEVRGETNATITKDNAYMIAVPDLHIGKLAHKDESGEDYDIKIAEDRFNKAIDSLIQRVNMDTVEKIIFPVGNDLMNVDNNNKMTTAGTIQDTDTRYFKMFQATIRIITNAINKLTTYAPVDVIVIPGNHDETSMLTFGLVLEAYYNNTDQVNVDCSPKLRKYYKYGKVGMQFTHGDKEPHTSLGMIFASEQPRLWADTKFRFCMLGHLHKSKKLNYVSVDEHPGFMVQIIPSLSSADRWHHSRGYQSIKQAKSFLYNKTEGLVGEFSFTV